MRFGRSVCHHCHRTEDDPRRLITIAYTFAARHSTRGRPLSRHITHVDCFLDAGGSIDGLADSQLWHVPTATWQRLGYLPGDSRTEYARVQDEERMAAPRTHAAAPTARTKDHLTLRSGQRPRLEGSASGTVLAPILRDAPVRRGAPQDEVVVGASAIPASRGPHPCRVPRSLSPSRADRGARSDLRRAA